MRGSGQTNTFNNTKFELEAIAETAKQNVVSEERRKKYNQIKSKQKEREKKNITRSRGSSCRAMTESKNGNLLGSLVVRQWPKALTLRLIREIACLLHPPCVAVEWPSRQRF